MVMLGLGFFLLYVFVDVLTNEFTGYNKIVWIIVILFLPVVGSVFYFILGQSQKIIRGDE